MGEAEKCENLTLEHKDLQKLYQETEGKYQTMLTMYGEKVLNETVKNTLGKEITGLKQESESGKIGLEVAKQDLDSEKRKNIALLEQLKDRDRRLKELSNDLENSKNFRAKSSSPA